MEFSWVTIAMSDISWIALAFILGFLSRSIGLPPLVGFLAAGFILSTQDIPNNQLLERLADLGITLLLFTIGLKLNLRTLARPQVWAVSFIHALLTIGIFAFVIYGITFIGYSFIADLGMKNALIIAFALSFSSTVFVAKVLEEKGDIASLHGRIAIGILIMQDIAAVVFLAASSGKLPSLWALLLFLLIPLRPVLSRVLQGVGRGELLVLYGFLLAVGGSELFELVGMKGDLGALILGALIANHARSEELAKTMLGFKDLFLLGFFLSIGLSAQPTTETFILGALIAPFVLIKSALFFGLLTRFRLRARTALLASFCLTNYSEFGLIVLAVAVDNGWIDRQWLVVIAIALSLSFAIAAVLNAKADYLYSKYNVDLRKLQRNDSLVSDDQLLDIKGASIAVVGMGRVGTGAYDKMRSLHGETVVGVDIDPVLVERLQATGRNILLGDPSDSDFWDRIQKTHTVKLMMLTLPKLEINLSVLDHIAASTFTGQVAATARFPDEVEKLMQAGATTVFDIYNEAGAGFAEHVVNVRA